MRLRAIVLQRCPRCLAGPVFHGLMSMYERCPSCGLRFEREVGYWTGAMVVSYVLSVPGIFVVFAALWWLTRWPIEPLILASSVLFLAVTPGIFRYARVVWMHLDRLADPERGQRG